MFRKTARLYKSYEKKDKIIEICVMYDYENERILSYESITVCGNDITDILRENFHDAITYLIEDIDWQSEYIFYLTQL